MSPVVESLLWALAIIASSWIFWRIVFDHAVKETVESSFARLYSRLDQLEPDLVRKANKLAATFMAVSIILVFSLAQVLVIEMIRGPMQHFGILLLMCIVVNIVILVLTNKRMLMLQI